MSSTREKMIADMLEEAKERGRNAAACAANIAYHAAAAENERLFGFFYHGKQLVDVGNALDDLRQVRRRHHTAGPFAVLRMVRELYGIEGPDINAEAAHREFRSAVASMSKNNVGLNGEDVLHVVLTKPCQNKRGVVSHAPAYF